MAISVGTHGSVARLDRRRDETSALRTERGILVGLVSGLGAATAHLIGGGHVAVGESAAVTAVAVLVGVALARSLVGVVRLALVVLGAQGALHLLMAGSMHASAGMAMGPSDSASVDLIGTGTPALMLLSHTLVAVVTVAFSRGADQALLDLARSLTRRLIPRLGSPRGPVPAVRRVHLIDRRLLPGSQRFVTPATNRGPPGPGRCSCSLP